jgi:hypothetical protein
MKIHVKYDKLGGFTLKSFLKPSVYYQGYELEEAKQDYRRRIA